MSIICLNNRSILSITGIDSVSFLQGIITQDLKKVTNNKIIYSLILTPKGRYESDIFIINNDNKILLDIPSTQLNVVINKLNFYKLNRKIKITNITNQWKIITLFKGSYLIDLPKEALCFNDPRNLNIGKRVLWPKNIKLPVFVQHKINVYKNHILSLGIPESDKDLINGKTIPLEANMEFLNAISWDKGCYLGQEFTTRSHYQGTIRKRILPVEIKGNIPYPQTTIFYKDKKAGYFSSGYKKQGLALLRLEYVLESIKKSINFKTSTTNLTASIPSWIKLTKY